MEVGCSSFFACPGQQPRSSAPPRNRLTSHSSVSCQQICRVHTSFAHFAVGESLSHFLRFVACRDTLLRRAVLSSARSARVPCTPPVVGISNNACVYWQCYCSRRTAVRIRFVQHAVQWCKALACHRFGYRSVRAVRVLDDRPVPLVYVR